MTSRPQRGARVPRRLCPRRRSVRRDRRADGLGPGDQRRARLRPLVPGEMDRDRLSSAAASPARRAGPAILTVVTKPPATPRRCARTRSASTSTRSTGAASSTRRPAADAGVAGASLAAAVAAADCRSARRSIPNARRPHQPTAPCRDQPPMHRRSSRIRRRCSAPPSAAAIRASRPAAERSRRRAAAAHAVAAERARRAANRAATREPIAAGFVNAVQVYPVRRRRALPLYAAPERVTDIALQPGETLVVGRGRRHRALGDRRHDQRRGRGQARACAGEAVRAPGSRPISSSPPTGAAIISQLTSTSRDRDGGDVLDLSAGRADRAQAQPRPAQAAAAPVAAGLDVEQLHFGYAITGDEPAWRPLRAFDDGRQTFIEFPASIARRRGAAAVRGRRDGRGAARQLPACAAATMSSTACSMPPSCGSGPRSSRSSASSRGRRTRTRASGGRHDRRRRCPRRRRPPQGRSRNAGAARRARAAPSGSGAA